MNDWDTIVIGGGLAGSSAAALLAAAGERVLLLERESHAHHKVCGEFLSYEADQYLQRLGIDCRLLGAKPISQLQLAYADQDFVVALPFQGLSISRFALDEALLQMADDAGATVMRGMTVSHLQRNAEIWSVTAGDKTYSAAAVILATGKRDLSSVPRSKGKQNDYIGFKMHWRLTREQTQKLQGIVSIFWFAGGYAGLELVEGNVANLCLVITKKRFKALGKRWGSLLENLRCEVSLLDRYLADAEPLWKDPLSVYGIPYGYLYKANRDTPPDLYRSGDQMAVIPSFSGDGMAMALHSGACAAQAILNGQGSYHHDLREDLYSQLRIASLVASFTSSRYGQWAAFKLSRRYPAMLAYIALKTRLQVPLRDVNDTVRQSLRDEKPQERHVA